MTNIKTDIKGRAYAKLSELKTGDKVEVDGGFTCMTEGENYDVRHDPERGFYIACNAQGGHALDGQLGDDGETLIGLYPVTD